MRQGGGQGGGQGAGPGGQGGGQGGGNGAWPRQGGGGGQGGGQRYAPQSRWRPRVPEIRASVEPKPFTVMLNCRQFQVLPTEKEVAEWFGDHLFSGETAPLLGRVGGLDIDERDKRIMIQLGSLEDVATLLARMGEERVAWPEFLDPATNQPIKIRGFSADKNSLMVTLLDVPRDVEDGVIREVLEKFGQVEEVSRHHLARVGMEHIKVNRVSVKMVKDKNVDLPATIFGLGLSTCGEERSVWRVTYPGAPRRCFRCGLGNHLARECRRAPLTLSQVEQMPAVGEVGEVAEVQGQQDTNFPRSFATVVKSAKFIAEAAEKIREAESMKQVQQAKKVADERRKTKEKADKEAARLGEEVKKKNDTEERRKANLERLAEKSREAQEYNEKIKSIHKRTEEEWRESRELEQRLETFSAGGGPGPGEAPSKRLRPGSTSFSTSASVEGGASSINQ